MSNITNYSSNIWTYNISLIDVNNNWLFYIFLDRGSNRINKFYQTPNFSLDDNIVNQGY